MKLDYSDYDAELERYVSELQTDYKTAECEYRLGHFCPNFTSEKLLPMELFERVKNMDRVVKKEYTVFLLADGVRVMDGKEYQKKTRVQKLDMDFVPVAARLATSIEQRILTAPAGSEMKTRNIIRYSVDIPLKSDAKRFFELSVSFVNSVPEVEAELKYVPRDKNELIEPLEILYNMFFDGRRHHILTRQLATRVLAKFNQLWSRFPEDGFIRRIGPRPRNVMDKDIDTLRNAKWATSNKLDGVYYILVNYDSRVYIANSIDVQCIGPANDWKNDAQFFDCEWEDAPGQLYAYDYQTTTDMTYEKRLDVVNTVVRSISLGHIHAKREFIDTIYKSTKKCVDWMRMEFGAQMEDRNDGVIHTELNKSYLDTAVFKFKFPTKSSIDLRLQVERETATEKHVKVFYQDVNRETELSEAKLTVQNDDPFYMFVTTGMIAEIGYEHGDYYILRLRPEKMKPNFVSVVHDTLHDMKHPRTMKEYLSILKSKHGGDAALLEEFDPALLVRAQRYIDADRKRFSGVFETVLKYSQKHDLRFSNPELMTGMVNQPEQLVLYSSNALREANTIANLLFECSEIIYMKTVIPYEEFEISVLNRPVVRVMNYPQIKGTDTKKIFKSNRSKILNYNVLTLDPEIELIEIYHKLYMPYPEKWEQNKKLETQLFSIIDKKYDRVRISGGAEKKMTRHEINVASREIRDAIFAALKFNDLGILIGYWGVYELGAISDPEFEKIQLLTDKDAEFMEGQLTNIIKDDFPELEFTSKIEPLYIPNDLGIRRTTFYVYVSDNRIPVLDTFNSLQYEIVPFVESAEKKIHVGTGPVISRFLLIDSWILNVLRAGDYIQEETLNYKTKKIIDIVKTMRHNGNDKYNKYKDYKGVFKDFAIERRRILQKEEKFRPYKPLEYKRQMGKLRDI